MAINFQTLKQLFEQEIGQVQDQAAPQASQTQPAAQPVAQPQQPVQQNPQSQTSSNAITVDKIVDHLNGIRSGKSFNDPLVFTAITNVFNSLSAAEKAVLDKALSQLDSSITQITKQQSPPNPNNQEVKAPSVKPEIGALAGGASAPNSFQGPQQVQQAMQSSPISGMMAGLIAETAFDIEKQTTISNDKRRAKTTLENSLADKIKTDATQISKLIYPIFMSADDFDTIANQMYQVLADNNLIGSYLVPSFRGRSGKSIKISNIAPLYQNSQKVLQHIETLLNKKPKNPSIEEQFLMHTVAIPEIQDIFFKEREIVEIIIDRGLELKKRIKNQNIFIQRLAKAIQNLSVSIEPDQFVLMKKMNESTDGTIPLTTLLESLNRPIKTSLVVNGKEVEFGSPEHITQITIVLNGLEDFKNCYKKGSSMRYTISNACGRIRKFLKDVEKRSDKTAAEATQEEELY